MFSKIYYTFELLIDFKIVFTTKFLYVPTSYLFMIQKRYIFSILQKYYSFGSFDHRIIRLYDFCNYFNYLLRNYLNFSLLIYT